METINFCAKLSAIFMLCWARTRTSTAEEENIKSVLIVLQLFLYYTFRWSPSIISPSHIVLIVTGLWRVRVRFWLVGSLAASARSDDLNDLIWIMKGITPETINSEYLTTSHEKQQLLFSLYTMDMVELPQYYSVKYEKWVWKRFTVELQR